MLPALPKIATTVGRSWKLFGGYSARLMLLTLQASSLRSMLLPGPGARKPKLALVDLPAFTKTQLGLGGLNLSTDLLVGAEPAHLEEIRERADKSGCACLVLVEPKPLALADPSADAAAAAIDRMKRVVRAAQLLGCNAAAMSVKVEDSEAGMALAAKRIKVVTEAAERLDINVLIAPSPGLTAVPERLTELIKKIGGFRVGTMPDFQVAAGMKDPTAYLRRLTPYAACVTATTIDFEVTEVTVEPPPVIEEEDDLDPLAKVLAAAEELADDDLDDDEAELDVPDEELAPPEEAPEAPAAPPVPQTREVFTHKPYDLKVLVDAIMSVGYDGTLAIDYRGEGDVTIGVTRSRKAIQALLDGPSRNDD